jgi:hypothetical protein
MPNAIFGGMMSLAINAAVVGLAAVDVCLYRLSVTSRIHPPSENGPVGKQWLRGRADPHKQYVQRSGEGGKLELCKVLSCLA